MKIIYISLILIVFLTTGCREPYFPMVNKDNPEIEEHIINDEKDSLYIKVDAAYYFVFSISLDVEVSILIENNSSDSIVVINNTESLFSKYYSYKKARVFPNNKEGGIVIYPKNKEKFQYVNYLYITGTWPFPNGQKEWPKLPEDEEVTFKLPVLLKGNKQITFNEIHFAPPKE